MKPCEAASHRRLRFVCTLLHSTQTTLLIHDRDTISSSELDAELKGTFGLRVLRTPVRAPQAHAYCERLMGTVRRECLDFMIPLHERQLRGTLRSWVAHYNKGHPHSSLGPGTPEPTPTQHLSQLHPLHPRHRLPRDCRITVEDILGGLHHE
jgi:putative transposase